MLAEYLAPLPMESVCTMAVCTGSGSVSAESCCLQATAGSRRPAAAADRQSRRAVECMDLLLPQGFFKGSLGIPEPKQALFVFVFGVGYRGLLLQYISQQHRGMVVLVVHLAHLLLGGVEV